MKEPKARLTASIVSPLRAGCSLQCLCVLCVCVLHDVYVNRTQIFVKLTDFMKRKKGIKMILNGLTLPAVFNLMNNTSICVNIKEMKSRRALKNYRNS